ncbi:response regulator [Anatilimnocola floriformis]|uniref:response regulator n=1 Tax=Anatilimnocola floriformis TaxID=2948575 RepID=UPI0020C4667A|nr:response regulator [Anatilimnocola floriformis]
MAHILLVEDSEEFRTPLAKLLSKAGHRVTEAPDGRAALAHVLAETPDLIITDVQMPEMDGPSLLEVIRSYLRLFSIPVVVLTGIEEGALIERARAQKVNSFMVKGRATIDDILEAVKQALITLPN